MINLNSKILLIYIQLLIASISMYGQYDSSINSIKTYSLDYIMEKSQLNLYKEQLRESYLKRLDSIKHQEISAYKKLEAKIVRMIEGSLQNQMEAFEIITKEQQNLIKIDSLLQSDSANFNNTLNSITKNVLTQAINSFKKEHSFDLVIETKFFIFINNEYHDEENINNILIKRIDKQHNYLLVKKVYEYFNHKLRNYRNL